MKGRRQESEVSCGSVIKIYRILKGRRKENTSCGSNKMCKNFGREGPRRTETRRRVAA